MADLTPEQAEILGLSPEEHESVVEDGAGGWRVLRVSVERLEPDGLIPGVDPLEPADLKAYLMRAATPEERAAFLVLADEMRIKWPALTNQDILERLAGGMLRLMGRI